MSNVYAAPNAQLSNSDTAAETVAFALNGRIGRLRYVAYATAMYFMVTIATMLIMIPLALMGTAAKEAGAVLPVLLTIVFMGFFVIIARRRLNDLGMSGWFVLCNFIPFVNFYFGLIMLFKRGDEGSNAYGAQPSDNTLGVKMVAFSLPVIAVIGIVAALIIPTLK